MNNLQDGLQVIIQTERSHGDLLCEGFLGIPIVNPVFIAITTDQTSASLRLAQQLRNELILTIRQISVAAESRRPPCNGIIGEPIQCHANNVNVCRKLLIIIGDGGSKISTQYDFTPWFNMSPNYHVLPVFPEGSNINSLLPSSLKKINCAFWSKSICEVIPTILSIAGLTSTEFKIFISYRRSDTSKLAEQLFDALTHENFDVFLDRFRVPPSVDFQQKLTQELSDKSMVLILESNNILNSRWTIFEILFALKHRLGLAALQVPGGYSIPIINSTQRHIFSTKDFNSSSSELSNASLEDCIQFIKSEHGKSMIRRREQLRNDMRDALLLSGIYNQSFDPDGFLRVETNSGGSKRKYAIWLTTRPPGLADFHITDMNIRGSSGIVIGPAQFLESLNKARIEWLSNKSGVKCFDEGNLLEVANNISTGVL